MVEQGKNLWRWINSGYFLAVSTLFLLGANFYRYSTKTILNTTHDDFAVDMLRARYEAYNGLDLVGHYSRTLGGTHPGPIYDWLLVLSNYTSKYWGMQPNIAAFYILTIFNLLILLIITRIIWVYYSVTTAKIFLLLVVLWQSVNITGDTNFGNSGELNFLNGGKLGSPLWPPYVNPYLFLLSLVSIHAYFKIGPKVLKYLLPSLILTSWIYLPYLYLILPTYLAVVCYSFLRGELRIKNQGFIISVILLLPLIYRLFRDGINYLKPNQLTLNQAERYFGDSSGWHPSNGTFVLEKLYGFPIYIIILITTLTLYTNCRVNKVKKSKTINIRLNEFWLVLIITSLGIVQIYLIYPSQIGIYQFNWVVFYSVFILAITISAKMEKFREAKLVSTIIILSLLVGSLITGSLLKLEPGRALISNSKTLAFEDNFVNILKEKGEKTISLTINSKEKYNLSSSLYWEVAPLLWEIESRGIDVCLTQVRKDLEMYVCQSERENQYSIERREGDLPKNQFGYESDLDRAFHPNTYLTIRKTIS